MTDLTYLVTVSIQSRQSSYLQYNHVVLCLIWAKLKALWRHWKVGHNWTPFHRRCGFTDMHQLSIIHPHVFSVGLKWAAVCYAGREAGWTPCDPQQFQRHNNIYESIQTLFYVLYSSTPPPFFCCTPYLIRSIANGEINWNYSGDDWP